MQTTLARRQRHRRAVGRRPIRRGGSALRRILIAIPIIILLVSLLLAGAGCAVHRGRVQLLRGRPARPQVAADRPRFRAADDRLRPDRQGRARTPRHAPSRARHLRPDPGRDARRDDGHRGQGFLGQRGLRSGRASSAPAWTRSPAARAAHRRSPSSSSAIDCCRPRRSRTRPTSARSARSSSRSA